jgi:hypothetical protein
VGDKSKFFSVINGREVYSGATKLWRCPECKWWREWTEEVCFACKTPRDSRLSGSPKKELVAAQPSRIVDPTEIG